MDRKTTWTEKAMFSHLLFTQIYSLYRMLIFQYQLINEPNQFSINLLPFLRFYDFTPRFVS